MKTTKKISKKLNVTLLTTIITFLTFSSVHSQEKAIDTLQIPEIVVTGTRQAEDVRHLPMSLTVINRNQIQKRYEQSLLPLLTEQVPGLFTTARGIMGYGVSTGGSGGINIRGIGGSPTTAMLLLIDGHPQYMGLMGHPIADAYQSMLAEKIEIIRGPASVLYGSNAMGGVINILTNKLQKDQLVNNVQITYGSFNTLTTEINSRFRRKKFSSIITASYNQSDGHRPNMSFQQYGGYAKLAYQFSRQWNLFTDLNLTHYNASNPGTISRSINQNDSRITRGMTSLSLENSYKHTSGALKLFHNWGEHKINDGYYTGEAPKDFLFNSKDLMLGITWYQNATLFKGNRITFGVDYQNFGGKANNVYFNGTSRLIIHKKENNIATYIDIRQSIAHIITLDAGLRLDHHSVTGTHYIPQFGASIYPIPTAQIKLLASNGFRNPTIREMYMFPPQNPNLQPEDLWNYEISWTQRLLNEKLNYGINIYYINGKNIIQTIPVNGKPLNMNTGKINNQGTEITATYHISKALTTTTNYSFLKMKSPVLAAPKHKLYIGVDLTQKRWSASTGIQYINKLYTSITQATTTQENFLLWNLRISLQATPALQLFAKGENLLNQKYQINLGFPMPGATVITGINITLKKINR